MKITTTRNSFNFEELIDGRPPSAYPRQYLAYFECFNRQLFYEAHDVLEELWLPQRSGPDGAFYKGLIQLTGAFVHLQKNRLRPAASLLKLARTNLQKYPLTHLDLDLGQVLALVETWLGQLENPDSSGNPFLREQPPEITLGPPRAVPE